MRGRPAAPAAFPGLLPDFLLQAVQVGGRGIDGRQLRPGKAVEQSEGAGSGPAAQIHDVAGAGPDGQPGGDGRDVFGEYFRVQVEDLRVVSCVVPCSCS